jgi:hypothetical protein
MARVAPRVYVAAADIAALEATCLQLLSNERVQLLLEDGTQLLGVVETMPGVQAFFDPAGREGMNALLRLEGFLADGRPHPDGVYDIWLDQVRAVTRLPNPSPPQTSTRAHPADPNAPTPQ